MVSSEFSMVRSLCKWLCENSILLKVHRATNTPIRPCVQVGAGEVAPISRRTVQARFSSLGAGVAFALGLTAWGAFFSSDQGRFLHGLDLVFFGSFEPLNSAQLS